MWKQNEQRWSENLRIEHLCKPGNFIDFNPANELKDVPLRHSFFFNGVNTLRDQASESADHISDHVNRLI